MSLGDSKALTCGRCGARLAPGAFNAPSEIPCPRCGVETRVWVFPALFETPAAPSTGQPAAEGEATCFYHNQKQAVTSCDGCGRFLCGLCDVELDGQHLCASCISAGRRKGSLKLANRQHVLYDEIALSLAIVPLIMWPLTILTAPATLFVVVQNWRKPLSLVPRSRIRYVLASMIAGLQLLGWMGLVSLMLD